MRWYDETTQEHQVIYDGEDDPCFFDLSIDVANGDLIVDED